MFGAMDLVFSGLVGTRALARRCCVELGVVHGLIPGHLGTALALSSKVL